MRADRDRRPLAWRVDGDAAKAGKDIDTALMVLGTDDGIALAKRLNLAALFIERTDEGFAERATPRFEALTAKR